MMNSSLILFLIVVMAPRKLEERLLVDDEAFCIRNLGSELWALSYAPEPPSSKARYPPWKQASAPQVPEAFELGEL